MTPHSLADGTELPADLPSRAAPFIERAPLPMVEVEGVNHTIAFVNSAFCRLLKKERSDLIGLPFSDIVLNGDKCIPLLDRVYQTGEFETHAELDPAAPDPSFWLFAMWPTLDLNARPIGVVIQLTRSMEFRRNIAEVNEALLIAGLREHELRESAQASNAQMALEISERKRIEQALLEAKAQLRHDASKLEEIVAQRTVQLRDSVEELEAFSYSLVHDLRAPVRAIHGFAQLTLEMPRDEVGPAAAEMLTSLIKAATRMDSLIRDVLRLGEVILKPIEVESIDLDELVQSIVREHPEYFAQQAEIEIDRPLLRMRGHNASLSQCINNLLNNAVKFVKPGAKPYLHLWSEERALPPRAEDPWATNSSSFHPRSTVRLWIEDRGIGIAETNQEKIFHIFQRLHDNTQYEGTGIGLAIVRKAITRMGGTSGVESTLGHGSRFWLELPSG